MVIDPSSPSSQSTKTPTEDIVGMCITLFLNVDLVPEIPKKRKRGRPRKCICSHHSAQSLDPI